jgi:hypothetical protein
VRSPPSLYVLLVIELFVMSSYRADTNLRLHYSIVAVHGLGGHPMNTWTHASTGNLWLRDFLPFAIPNARIMTFGYDARVVGSRSILGIMENANGLLTHLCNYRNSRDLEVCDSSHIPVLVSRS